MLKIKITRAVRACVAVALSLLFATPAIAAGDSGNAAGDAAGSAGNATGTVQVVLQERLPYLQQLRDDIAALKAEQRDPKFKKQRGALAGEIKRLEAAARDLERDAPLDLAVRQRVETWDLSKTPFARLVNSQVKLCPHLQATEAEYFDALRKTNTAIAAAGSAFARLNATDPTNVEELFRKIRERGGERLVLAGLIEPNTIAGVLKIAKDTGIKIALIRDLCDTPCNGKSDHFADHFSARDLAVADLEKLVPTLVSSEFLAAGTAGDTAAGKPAGTAAKQFRPSADTRPRIAFLAAEGEYQSSRRLEAWSRELLAKNIASDFALGRPVMTGAGRHDLHNLQILDDAALAVFAIRRRALAPEKMARIRAYVASGRPVLGFRAAPTSFDAKGNVPATGGGIVAAKNAAPKFLAQWPRFDQEVLGGNYQGHYGHYKQGTTIRVVAGKGKHPLLRGVAGEFNSPAWLYINTPLASPRAEVLLTGRDPGYPKNAEQPVLWTNGRNVINTSLGHWNDWENPNFRALMNNAVQWLLGGV
jgi:type 1 glutamine amidotransferase